MNSTDSPRPNDRTTPITESRSRARAPSKPKRTAATTEPRMAPRPTLIPGEQRGGRAGQRQLAGAVHGERHLPADDQRAEDSGKQSEQWRRRARPAGRSRSRAGAAVVEKSSIFSKTSASLSFTDALPRGGARRRIRARRPRRRCRSRPAAAHVQHLDVRAVQLREHREVITSRGGPIRNLPSTR